MGTYRHYHVYSDDIGTVFIYFRKTSSLEESRIYFSNLFLSSDLFSKYICSEQKSELINHDNAIIMAPSVTVKSTPNQSGTDLFILHEGRKVIIKDNTMKEWKEIKLEDGNVGWVPTNVIEII